MADSFDPSNVNLNDAMNDSELMTQITCYLTTGPNGYDGKLGARISSIFVIFVCSTALTFFPVLATRVKALRIPLYVYLFARYFGSGVIVATAFVHLLDPAYAEIGPATCVGMTGGWATYSWPPAIALTSSMVIFLMDFAAERYVETKYGLPHDDQDVEEIITGTDPVAVRRRQSSHHDHLNLHNADQRSDLGVEAGHGTVEYQGSPDGSSKEGRGERKDSIIVAEKSTEAEIEQSFMTQIAAFLILEFGVVFHSVIIGLNLGTSGTEFVTLYIVLIFHQSFEGLGIGARLSAIPFPKRLSWMPWALCAAYGLTTPISIAIGLGVRTTYSPTGFTASVVSGLLDSISAGILIYTGLVELLARDFLYDPNRTKDNKRLTFMVCSVLLGAGIMALLGKWA